MSNDGATLGLYNTDGERIGDVHAAGVDVTFPLPDVRWTWVLDARSEPYNELPTDVVLQRAVDVRKRWVLFAEPLQPRSDAGSDAQE